LATKPKSKPAHRGWQRSLSELRKDHKDAVLTLTNNCTALSSTISATPVNKASHLTIPATLASVTPTILNYRTVPSAEVQHPPLGPCPLPHDYTSKYNDYYHGQPPVGGMDNHIYSTQPPMSYQNSVLSRFLEDREVPTKWYKYQSDYYGYVSPFQEYYRHQTPYMTHLPAPYHQLSHYDLHLQPNVTTTLRGLINNVMASLCINIVCMNVNSFINDKL